jgi:predicted acyl esterase
VSPAPVRTYLRAHASPLEPGAVERAVVDLLPVAHRFARGARLCLSVASADRDHFSAPPPASLQLLRSRDYASVLELPVE